METFLVWARLILFLITYAQVSSCLNKTVGFFRKVGEHPELKRCALISLRKSKTRQLTVKRAYQHINEAGYMPIWQQDYVGMRVHDVKGECEGLSRDRAVNQAKEPGYSYIKRVQTRRIFEPLLVGMKFFLEMESGPREGERLEVTVLIPLDCANIFYGLTNDTFTISTMIARVSIERQMLDKIAESGLIFKERLKLAADETCMLTFETLASYVTNEKESFTTFRIISETVFTRFFSVVNVEDGHRPPYSMLQFSNKAGEIVQIF